MHIIGSHFCVRAFHVRLQHEQSTRRSILASPHLKIPTGFAPNREPRVTAAQGGWEAAMGDRAKTAFHTRSTGQRAACCAHANNGRGHSSQRSHAAEPHISGASDQRAHKRDCSALVFAEGAWGVLLPDVTKPFPWLCRGRATW
jgi:hypothetical protein